MDLCKFTEELWKMYLLDSVEKIEKELLEKIKEDVVIIGTGKHEYYDSLCQFEQALGMEAKEREMIHFEIQSLWCKEKKLGADVSLVYGCVYIKGKEKGAEVAVDMDTRFSVLYEKVKGQWKVAHIHQSLPYREQKEGEYYPKTLMEQVGKEKKRADEMEELAKTDHLTGLLNNRAFFEESNRILHENLEGWCLAIDLDDFKMVNDQYGHQAGDSILRTVGNILKECIGKKGITGRIGGDEFAVFYTVRAAEEDVRENTEKIMKRIRQEKEKTSFFPGISIGIAYGESTDGIEDVLRRADRTMYEIKRTGKNDYQIEKK